MTELEIRKYCLDKAIEILSWRTNFFPKKEHNPLIIAEAIYQYLKTGNIQEIKLPGSRD